MVADAEVVHVFTLAGRGGNPCPIVHDARSMSAADMQAIARKYGHESGFVCPSSVHGYDFGFRFWVPNHEMEMCGHATIGALWLLASRGVIGAGETRIDTLSGAVTGYVAFDAANRPCVEITQPVGRVLPLKVDAEEEVLSVLGLSRADTLDLPVQNAATSRVKTLVPVKNMDRLQSLTPDFAAIRTVCAKIGSTGLYPYAVVDFETQTFEARQFPKSSGYPEDAATGIAAAALAFGLLGNGLAGDGAKSIRIMQGRAIGSLSQINVKIRFADGKPIGCLLGGAVTPIAR